MADSKTNNYYGDLRLRFIYYNNKKELLEKGLAAYEENQKKIKKNGGSIWEANRMKIQYDAYKDMTEYSDPSQLNNSLNIMDKLISDIDFKGSTKKSRLKITSDPRGIFDFGLASKGLYEEKEYFSKELADESPDEFNGYKEVLSGLVPDERVESKINTDPADILIYGDVSFWYVSSKSKKKYILTQQNKNQRLEELNGLPIGSMKEFSSTIRRSYLITEKKSGKPKMVDLYFPKNQGISFVALCSMIMAVKFFDSIGVKTRVLLSRIYEKWPSMNIITYPVKDYNEAIDYNAIAMAADDKWWDVICFCNSQIAIKEISESSPSSPLSDYKAVGSIPINERSMNDLFCRYRNWYFESMEKGLVPKLQIDKKLLIYGLNYNVRGKDIKDENNKKATIKYFYKIIDKVEFQFSEPYVVCSRIYKRMVEEEIQEFMKTLLYINADDSEKVELLKSKKNYYITQFKNYVQNLLLDSYIYPETGYYAEKKEDAIKLEEELDSKLKILSEFLLKYQ